MCWAQVVLYSTVCRAACLVRTPAAGAEADDARRIGYLLPTPYNLHPQHPTTYTLNTLHPTPTLYSPYTLHPTPFTLNPFNSKAFSYESRYMPSGAKLMEVLLDASLPTDAAEEILRLVKHQVAPNPNPNPK